MESDALMRVADADLSAIADAVRPVRVETLRTWVENHVVMPTGSPIPGPFRVDHVPAAVEIYDAWDDPAVREIIVRGPTQTLKSALMINTVLYECSVNPGPFVLLQPDKALAKNFAQVRIPDIAVNTALEPYFPKVGRGAAGGTIAERIFPGGTLKIVGVADISALISHSFRLVIIDEIEKMDTAIDVVGQTNSRMTTYVDARRLIASTPGLEGMCRITKEYERGDMREWHAACPECGELQQLDWYKVKYAKSDPSSARYECAHCEEMWDEGLLREANRNGSYVAQKEFSGIASFTMNALANPFVTMERLAREYIEANRIASDVADISRVRTFTQERRAVPFADKNRRLDAVDVQVGTAVNYPSRDFIPEEVVAATMAVDVQDDRLEWEIAGWAVAEVAEDDLKSLKSLGDLNSVGSSQGKRYAIRRYGLGYGKLPGDPTARGVWEELTLIYNTPLYLNARLALKPSIMFVDSGGHCTDAVRDYVAGRGRGVDEIYPVKGATKSDDAIFRISQSRDMLEKYANQLVLIGSFAAKEVVYRLLSTSRHQKAPSKFYSYPRDESRGYDLGYFEGLTSEEKILHRNSDGHVKPKWVVMQGRNNEPLDLAVYNLAAIGFLGGPNYLLGKREVLRRRMSDGAAK